MITEHGAVPDTTAGADHLPADTLTAAELRIVGAASREALSHPPVALSDRGVAILMGDGLPILLEDVTNPEEALDLLSEPLERRIVATRLRYWADVLDAADGGAS